MKDIDVKKIREELGMTQENFAKQLEVHYRTVQKWESGETKIRRANAFLIEELYNKHTKGVNNKEQGNNNGNAFIDIGNGLMLMKVPLMEIETQAGFADNYQDVEFLSNIDTYHSVIVNKVHRGRYVAFRVKGDSMDNGKSSAILSNSIVTCRELLRHHWADKLRYEKCPYWVIATSESRYPLLKQIIGHDIEKGIIKCHSLNESPDYSDFDLDLNKVTALFYVTDISKSITQ